MKSISTWIAVVVLLASCGDTKDDQPIFSVVITNATEDTVKSFGFDVNLPAIDSSFHLVTGNVPVDFQLEDRNENEIPDKLHGSIDLLPTSRYTIIARPGEIGSTPAKRSQVISRLIGSSEDINRYEYTDQDQWMLDGIVMENDVNTYRFLMRAPFAVDLIGKRTSDLILPDVMLVSDEIDQWGGDILAEQQSLGLGSPALCLVDEIYNLASFDSKEVVVAARGPLRSEVEIVTRGVPVRDEKIDVRQTWQLEAGKPWAEVSLEILTQTNLTLQFAFGIQKHEDATAFTQGKQGVMHFAYTWGPQSSEGDLLGMAVMVRDQYEIDNFLADPHNSFYLAAPLNNKVEYRVMYHWSGDPLAVTDEVQFINIVKDHARQYAQQPVVEVDFDLSD